MANRLTVLTAVGIALGASAVLPGQAVPINANALHALNRITFGATLPLLQQLSLTPTTGPNSIDIYVDAQIAMTGLEDPRVPMLLAQLPTPRTTIQQVKQEQFVRACFSRFQLREVMTQFWQRHFNTNYLSVNQTVTALGGTTTDAVQMIDEVNQAFRANALGRFEDLLLANLDSRAMNFYLSMFNSQSGPGAGVEPNEDAPRENCELWTLGVDGPNGPNYSHDDIEALAECLAGWSVYWSTLPNNLTFRQPITGAIITNPVPMQRVFIQQWHENGVRHFDFDATTTADDLTVNGVSTSDIDARLVVAHMARMEQTKRFVCSKLIDFFLADGAAQQQPALLTQCMNAWGLNGGDIAAVLGTILKSPVFQGTTYRWQRLRQPMDFTCWIVRALDGDATTLSNLDGVIGTTDLMGQNLHHYPSPDGYPNQSKRQPGSQVYVDAARHAQAFLRTLPPYNGIVIHDLPGMVINGIGQVIPGGDPDNPQDVAQYFLQRLFVGNWSTGDLVRCTDLTLETVFGNPAPLDHVGNPTDYGQRISLLAALAVVLPQGLKK